MLGLNHSVRNTPDSRIRMNENSAISPSRKLQWSGKTFRIRFFEPL
jgi:hypothetical protein